MEEGTQRGVGDPHGATPCSSGPEVDLGRTVDVRLVTGPGVSLDVARRRLRAADAVWGPLGLTLHEVGHGTTELEVLFATPSSDAGPDALLASTKAFQEAQRDLSKGELVLAVLPRIAPSTGPVRRAMGAVRGLSLSPWLPDAGEGATARLRARLDLARRGPVVFVDESELRMAPVADLDTTVAHELGHVLGLAHASDRDNLMSRDPHRCIPGLSEAQIPVVEHALAQWAEASL